MTVPLKCTQFICLECAYPQVALNDSSLHAGAHQLFSEQLQSASEEPVCVTSGGSGRTRASFQSKPVSFHKLCSIEWLFTGPGERQPLSKQSAGVEACEEPVCTSARTGESKPVSLSQIVFNSVILP